ncbi:MAG TPA: K(+)-transporting ATPase subunit C [Rhodopila sp.]|jgi:K+-transporting ATPase ATPase C chain|nr:K(+)-transporting ATPase subunit C [Rhodopila sp.]
MTQHIRPAVMMIVLMTILTGLAYPLAMTGIAQVLFPWQANGSLIRQDGKVIGSAQIGQNFTGEGYFHGRPSATTDTDPNDSSKTIPAPYNAANSGGSNLGPTSKTLLDRITADTQKLAQENPGTPVPMELVTTSASGLDPDISPDAALFQVPRIAKARHLPEDTVRQLIGEHTTDRVGGIVGEPHINVLQLNLALDALKHG